MKTALVTVTLVASCAAVSPKGDASAKDVVIDTSGPYPCGALTCADGQYCIHPCCSLACASSVSGACPFGTRDDATCSGGCRQTSCAAPPMYCSSNDPCIGIAVTNRDAFCVCG